MNLIRCFTSIPSTVPFYSFASSTHFPPHYLRPWVSPRNSRPKAGSAVRPGQPRCSGASPDDQERRVGARKLGFPSCTRESDWSPAQRPSLWRSSPCSRGLILALFKALLYHGKRTQALAPAGANCFALSAPNCRAPPPPPPGSGAAPCPSAQAGVP